MIKEFNPCFKVDDIEDYDGGFIESIPRRIADVIDNVLADFLNEQGYKSIATEEFNNVSRTFYVDVPASCCSQISVRNISEDEIDVQNANLIVERVA